MPGALTTVTGPRAKRKLWRGIVPVRDRQPVTGIFQSELVIHRMAEFLLAAEIALRCLNLRVTKQKLNLLKLAPGQMA